MNCIDLNKAKTVYNSGGNVTDFLRSELGEHVNSSQIIEIAYDLQAGTYIDYVNSSMGNVKAYTQELASHLEPHINSDTSFLDVGTGELTTLTLVLNALNNHPSIVLAFDISWSRLWKGIDFWRNMAEDPKINLFPFVADIKKIPLPAKSIDVVTSNHALEPNGSNLPLLLKELFRVCKSKIILFEPSYELNSLEGKTRMDKLGYIKGIENKVHSLGAKVLDVQLIKNTGNPLNPTACYVIEPPEVNRNLEYSNYQKFSVPGTNYELKEVDNFLASSETGLAFPVLKGIPLLKESSAILATSLFV